MIIVELAGGLGNQMFQYAFGKALSVRNKQKLFLDLEFLNTPVEDENFTKREYELHIFSISPILVSS